MDTVDRYKKVVDQMAAAAHQCGRKLSDITLVVVTKNIPWNLIVPLYQAGCRHFGENRMQDALSKQSESPEDVFWHFIGTLQKNKVRKAIERFELIHSVDTPELAKKISDTSLEMEVRTSILLEVNTSGERAKHGLSSEAWKRAFEEVMQMKGIAIEGLMTMAPYVENEKVIRACFAKLREMRDEMAAFFSDPATFRHLSMGMSHDFPIAIEEGATLLRVGTVIFQPD
jgi:pyridoxal phosphate enzyme (YggS family)